MPRCCYIDFDTETIDGHQNRYGPGKIHCPCLDLDVAGTKGLLIMQVRDVLVSLIVTLYSLDL